MLFRSRLLALPAPVQVGRRTSAPQHSFRTPQGTSGVLFRAASSIYVEPDTDFRSFSSRSLARPLDYHHQTNLANSTTVTEATVRKVASLSKHVAGKSGTSTPSPAPQYVDRAAARRQAFNQPNHPVRESKRAKMNEVPAPTPAPLEQPHKNGIEESNVGAKMLEKMVRSSRCDECIV